MVRDTVRVGSVSTRVQRYGKVLVLAGLVVLQFALSPLWPDLRIAPDFMLLALMIFAMRSRPGSASAAGFVVGVVNDSISRVAFGAEAIAYTIVGYLASWSRAVFFAENLMVNAVFFFGGSWFRDVLVLAAGGMSGAVIPQILWWSVLKGLSTAVAGVLILMAFGNVLKIRIAH